jgi:hypothetical protein
MNARFGRQLAPLGQEAASDNNVRVLNEPSGGVLNEPSGGRRLRGAAHPCWRSPPPLSLDLEPHLKVQVIDVYEAQPPALLASRRQPGACPGQPALYTTLCELSLPALSRESTSTTTQQQHIPSSQERRRGHAPSQQARRGTHTNGQSEVRPPPSCLATQRDKTTFATLHHAPASFTLGAP